MAFGKQQFQQQSGEMTNQAAQYALAQIWQRIYEQIEEIESSQTADKKTATAILKSFIVSSISYCYAKKNKEMTATEKDELLALPIETLISRMGKAHISAGIYPSNEFKGTDVLSRSKLYWEKAEAFGGETFVLSKEVKALLKEQIAKLKDEGKIKSVRELEEETLPEDLWLANHEEKKEVK